MILYQYTVIIFYSYTPVDPMKITEFQFESLPEEAQFCTNTLIYAFHETGFIEFKAFCMINAQAQPYDVELEKKSEDSYVVHILTNCDMPVMSEKCILVTGRLTCPEVNQQLFMTVQQEINWGELL